MRSLTPKVLHFIETLLPEEEQAVQQKPEKQQPAHRFQKPSCEAPISARQKRKRKKDQESQAVLTTESAGSS